MQNYYLFLSFITFYQKKYPIVESFSSKADIHSYFICPQMPIPQIIRQKFGTLEISCYICRQRLFGSFARGEETPESDVDILVEFDQNSRVSLMKHAGMIVDLEQKLNRPIDLVVNGTLLPFATKSAERDKILIYERAN